MGQTTTGTIAGSVTDPTGSVIPNASITVTNVQTGISQNTHSNASGNYIFPSLQPGDYTLSAQSAGFGTTTESGLHLDVLQTLTSNVQLKLGSESETVTVSTAAAMVELRESQLSTTVAEKQISDLPLNGQGRNQPRAVGARRHDVCSFGDHWRFCRQQVQLERKSHRRESYYLDGSYDTSFMSQGGNVIPNPDALQEFRVLTNNFDAEYGRYPGGVVNAITRSGTNTFHALAYDYLRNSKLNLKNYFATRVTPLVQNQFGAAAAVRSFATRHLSSAPMKGCGSQLLRKFSLPLSIC